MAITKIHAIRATVDKAVNYICNPAKTDDSILISSFGCSPETAAFDFKFSLSQTNQSDPNKAFHLIQAFLPGEVSYEEAHQIGIELADKLLEGKYSYIVATHIDKGHTHNHIIFCAADNVEHKKYHDCKKSYAYIRRINDELCAGHHLSVIGSSDPNRPGQRGKKYNEWLSDKNGQSWKNRLKSDIDNAIRNANSYEIFLELIRAGGYEIKGESFAEGSHKYISFRPLDREHFIRGSVKSLGTEYTKERILERISNKPLEYRSPRSPFLKRHRQLIKNYSSRKLIDVSEEKFRQSPALKHWAEIENLKIAASNYQKAGSIIDLKKQYTEKAAVMKTARNSLAETDRQLKELGQIIKYAEQYTVNQIYHVRYIKSKNPESYLRRHESELLLHDGAENMLRRMGIDPKTLDTEKLRRQYDSFVSKRNMLQDQYKSTEKEISVLRERLDTLNQYLGTDAPNHVKRELQATEKDEISSDPPK